MRKLAERRREPKSNIPVSEVLVESLAGINKRDSTCRLRVENAVDFKRCPVEQSNILGLRPFILKITKGVPVEVSKDRST